MIEKLETRYGRMFIPSTDTGQYYWLKNTGASPEDDQIEMICEMLDERPKGIALDCGANFGCWALALARHSLLVHAYEPQPAIAKLLRGNAEANGLSARIKVHEYALGRERGQTTIPLLDLDRDANFGGVSIGIPHSEAPSAPSVSVDVFRLDDLIIRGEVSFIKADVEGSELALLQGAQNIIRKDRPIIVAEADHPLTDTQALGSFIESLGYNVEIFRDNNFIGVPV